MNEILSYKGFNKDLQCRGFQYEIGKDYEQEGEIECCKKGFHACKFPTDVLWYYPPVNGNRYCTVTQSGDISKNNVITDFKIASSKIHIGSEISVEQLIDASIKYILDNTKYPRIIATDTKCFIDRANTTIENNRYNSVAVNAGRDSVAINNEPNSIVGCTNEHSVVVNNGPLSIVGTTEDSTIITNTEEGDSSVCCSIGAYSIIKNSSYKTTTISTGLCSYNINNGFKSVAIGTSANSVIKTTRNYSIAIGTGSGSDVEAAGDYSVAVSTDRYSSTKVAGTQSIAIATGISSTAAGDLGDWIVLTEHMIVLTEHIRVDTIKEVKAFKVDGDKIKANTFYKLKDGKAVEVNLKKY